MTKFLRFPLGCLLLLGLHTSAKAAGNVRIHLFDRELSSAIWSDADQQLGFGIEAGFGKKTWPVLLTGRYSRTSWSNTCDTSGANYFCFGFPPDITFDAWMSEWSFGVNKLWRQELRARPFLGGGIALVFAGLDGGDAGLDVEERTEGAYANAGVLWSTVGSAGFEFDWGFEVRALTGTSLESDTGDDGDADYLQFGFFFGANW